MNKVYAIWVGEYSSADVIGIAYDEHIAEAYAKIHDGYICEAPIITDENLIAKANALILEYRVWIDEEGRCDTSYIHVSPEDKKEIEVKEREIEYLIDKKTGKHPIEYVVYIYSQNEIGLNETKKIAFDKLAKYKAEKMGV